MPPPDRGPQGISGTASTGTSPVPVDRGGAAGLTRRGSDAESDPDTGADGPRDAASADVDERIAWIAMGGDLTRVADVLAAQREATLARWLAAAKRQPFHERRPDGAVADHIPVLLDALIALLRHPRPADGSAPAPLDDPDVAREAEAHAQVRFEQGHGPVAVITEFRLLRQEVSRTLGEAADGIPAADIVRGLAVLNDGLDGAAAVGLSALTERISTLRESFLATFLHDVRQPITLVEGSLVLADRWLSTPDSDPDRTGEAVRDALRATAELVSMIDTMSDASRVAMGALDPRPEPVSLEAVVGEVVGSIDREARDRIEVTVTVGRRQVGMWDAGLLRRLITNLIGNALKYSPDGSPVRIAITEAGGNRTRLVVADRGIGLPAEERALVFERFARAERVRGQGIPGLGLGLYACQGIVQAHGGTIDIHSPGTNQGTTVTVELPLLEPSTIDD